MSVLSECDHNQNYVYWLVLHKQGIGFLVTGIHIDDFLWSPSVASTNRCRPTVSCPHAPLKGAHLFSSFILLLLYRNNEGFGRQMILGICL